MSNVRGLTTKAAREAGIDPALYRALILHGERSWKGWQTSPVGASGPAQLMPATAASLGRKYGVDTNSFYGNLLAGAYYLKEQLSTFGGNRRKAVAAYNAGPGAVQRYGGVPPYAETQRYVTNVLGGLKTGGPALVGQPGAPRAPRPPSPPARMPNFALGSLESIAMGGSAVDAFGKMLEQERTWKPPKPVAPQGAPGVLTPLGAPRGGPGGGKITIAKGADRAGVKTGEAVLAFARRVAAQFGGPLTIGTGTNHSRLTVNGNVSDHWDGNAVDLPATGKKLLRMGRAALIAAGADPKWARKQNGGLYNIGGHQIIFRTTEGGNHWNHLHVSV